MDHIKRNRERRMRQHYEGLRTTKPACPYCCVTDARMFERHHIFEEPYGEETCLICKNHHAVLNDLRLDHPGLVFDPPDEFDRIIHALANSADMFELMAPALRKYSQWLSDWHQKSIPSDEKPDESKNHNPKPGDKKS